MNAPGDRIDRYRVEDILGRGASSIVLGVADVESGQRFALKLLTEPSLRDRLLREGRLLSAIRHPNIVAVRRVIPSLPALLLDRVDGLDLSTVIAGGQPSLEEALRITHGILAGLRCAHEQGVVHRDLKPSNVLLDGPERLPRLTDFGLARSLHLADVSLTATGDALGTVAYLAPEQMDDARSAGPPADLFSAGVILYEMLAGMLPFGGPTAVDAVERARAGSYIPLGELRPDLPERVCNAVERCLRADPAERPQSCGEVEEILDGLAAARGPEAEARHLLARGSRIGSYVVEELIGEGAVARVYRVRHTRLDHPFALKVLRNPSSPEAAARLVREGRAQSRLALHTRNVVAVTDVIDVAGVPALVMEWVPGPSLRDRLETGPLDPAELDALVPGMVAGLAAAHREGIVHRDLKPANILLAPGPEGALPKLADFGLAQVEEDEAPDRTQAGQPLGSPAYMSPEQIRSARDVDARSDIFSLGATLWEMCCGRRCFADGSRWDVYASIMAGRASPPRELVPELPRRMDQAIRGALVVDLEARIPDAETLLAVWRGEQTWPPGAGVSEPVPRRSRRIALGLALSVGLILGLVVLAPPSVPERIETPPESGAIVPPAPLPPPEPPVSGPPVVEEAPAEEEPTPPVEPVKAATRLEPAPIVKPPPRTEPGLSLVSGPAGEPEPVPAKPEPVPAEPEPVPAARGRIRLTFTDPADGTAWLESATGRHPVPGGVLDTELPAGAYALYVQVGDRPPMELMQLTLRAGTERDLRCSFGSGLCR